MKQVDLLGFDVMTCKKCGRCFETMKESSKHHVTKHRKITIKKISINFALENYCIMSEKTTIVTKSNLLQIRGGERK